VTQLIHKPVSEQETHSSAHFSHIPVKEELKYPSLHLQPLTVSGTEKLSLHLSQIKAFEQVSQSE
jgi:hypothetical protein